MVTVKLPVVTVKLQISDGRTANSDGETANRNGETGNKNGKTEMVMVKLQIVCVFVVVHKVIGGFLYTVKYHDSKFHALPNTLPMSALPVTLLLFLLPFLLSFPCLLPFCSSHAASQCNSHPVPFQATASGFTWLSLAGLFYCSRGWLLPGISTLLGPWLVNVSAQSVSAHCWWHFAVVLALGRGVCHKGRDSVYSQGLRFLHSRAPAK